MMTVIQTLNAYMDLIDLNTVVCHNTVCNALLCLVIHINSSSFQN